MPYQIRRTEEGKARRAAFLVEKKRGRPAKETTANLQNANGAPAVSHIFRINETWSKGNKKQTKGKGRFSYC